MKPLLFRPEVEDDLDEISRWYDDKKVGLGDSFLKEVERVLEKISQNPHRYPVLRRDVRCARLTKFPYGVFYYVADDRAVVVLTVLHHSRDPSQWVARRSQ